MSPLRKLKISAEFWLMGPARARKIGGGQEDFKAGRKSWSQVLRLKECAGEPGHSGSERAGSGGWHCAWHCCLDESPFMHAVCPAREELPGLGRRGLE